MSITFNIYYSGGEGSARKFAQEMLSGGVVDKIMAEKGNIKYEYFYPADDEQTVLLIDSWEDKEALDKHHSSPMMAEIARLREKYDLHMKVEKYVSVEDFEVDNKFIRN